MYAAAASFNFRSIRNVIQFDIAAGSLRFDLAIALGYLDGPAASLQRHDLGPADIQIAAARFSSNMPCGRRQPDASASSRSLHIIPNFADINVAAAA